MWSLVAPKPSSRIRRPNAVFSGAGLEIVAPGRSARLVSLRQVQSGVVGGTGLMVLNAPMRQVWSLVAPWLAETARMG